jgi:acetolactate synthase-1/2/3 large subunit
VVLALPEDMLTEEAEIVDAQPYHPVETWPGAAPMAALRERLAAAKRPFLLLGGSAWDA